MNLKKLVTIILCAIILSLTLVSADNNDDLEDFDFINSFDGKSTDYDEFTEKSTKLDELFDSGEQKEQNSFDFKEKAIRMALTKALTNKVLRQKFVEVLPIIRVLSSQQRVALAALISAQISAKPGTELKLEQVKSMFGDSKKLIIPLVFDIANLVKTAAKNSLHYIYDYYTQSPQQYQISASRRNFVVAEPEEVHEVRKDGIDPMMINDQLYRIRNSRRLENSTKSDSDIIKHSRVKRSGLCPYADCSFTDQATAMIPGAQNIQSLPPAIQSRSFQDPKLNTTNFISSYDKVSSKEEDNQKYQTHASTPDLEDSLPLEQLENLAFDELNATYSSNNNNNNNLNLNNTMENFPEELLPTPEGLVGNRKRGAGNKLGNGNGSRKTPPRPVAVAPPRSLLQKKCEKFTPSMCITTDDYPTELILGSIRRHKHAMSALLAEYRDKSAEQEHEEYLEELESSQNRREDGENDLMPGGMCQSVVKYARPQKARSASGEWKYIVNTGQHSQTLRLEKCSHPQASCSYLSENYRSRCVQVYNFHRLLSWDKARGLHVEIFKVPICCSCHVDGYRDPYPPAPGSYQGKYKDFTIKNVKTNPYSTIDDDEYEDEDFDEGDDSIAYQFGNGFKKIKQNKYDPSELLSSGASVKNRFESSKKQKTSSTFSSPVSPSTGSFDPLYNFKRSPNLSTNTGGFLSGLNRFRRPQQGGYESGARVDQELAGSKLGKEVTVYPPIDKTTIRPKRKRVSSVSTATTKPAPISSFLPTTVRTTTNARNFHHPKIANTKSDVNKRINYNYHPIIDFFGEHAQQPPVAAAAAAKKQKRMGPTATTKDRRMGIGGEPHEENWRPIIIE